jgi:serine/threonine protein phosphatase 1
MNMTQPQLLFSTEVRPGDCVAVGDIHGRSDLLDLFLDHVRGSGARVIFLGDLIDRGPDDLGVLDRVKRLLDDPESHGLESVTVLRGNHEQMFINAMEGPFQDAMLWVQNGGNTERWHAMAADHLEWIKETPHYVTVDDTLFVHAGVRPGLDPADTDPDTLVWIREPFLTQGPELNKWTSTIKRVVHGHTPYFDDHLLGQVNVSASGDRVGIDSGSYFTGVLTAYNASQDTYHQHRI